MTDANSCLQTATVNITQPAALVASISAQTNIICNGASTGSATVSASGGNPNYTYSWAPSGGTAAIASGPISRNLHRYGDGCQLLSANSYGQHHSACCLGQHLFLHKLMFYAMEQVLVLPL
ncbi:SprB repeat-containing protein [Lacihabitans soyangensis]|uniref:SprB repeat-containing protein n=1 Tax=Lacihabitans soyangensis TaxID=869394 RepID=UPI0020CDA7F8|nr:SprB repeat-containing protein [Lacihabitans soyangensis]